MRNFYGEPLPDRRRAIFREIHASQTGAALVISLFLLLALLLLGTSAAQLALQGEKASRGDRDRQIALQAAEAALMDAELDIEHSPDGAKSRSHIFSRHGVQGFSSEGESRCNAGLGSMYLGLCNPSPEGVVPSWQLVDFSDQHPVSTHSVPYGRFTGQRLAIGQGTLPRKLPRYVIELMVYRPPGEEAGKSIYVYRVTAIGFGMRESTQVVLQSVYRKESA